MRPFLCSHINLDSTETSILVNNFILNSVICLQASLNWTKSTDSEREEGNHSSVSISELSSIAATSQPIDLSYFTSLDSYSGLVRADTILSIDSHLGLSNTGTSVDGSDSVFLQSLEKSNSEFHSSIEFTENDMMDLRNWSTWSKTEQCGKCSCRRTENTKSECSECQSHIKAPSRQEKLTDDTPQMHRTDESVWNSYAAKNLEALRLGSYTSEDSDSDANSKEIENAHQSSIPGNSDELRIILKAKCVSEPVRKHNPRRLVKMKNFSYPSDDESGGESRYKSRVKFARKRSFCDVEQSPRRASSADTGLTQELRILRFNGCEPCSKRSNSLPRTRIRFSSGQDTWKRETVQSKLGIDYALDTNICLTKIATGDKKLSDSDNLELLSADENRLVEGMSDTSVSEPEQSSLSETRSCDSHDQTRMSEHNDACDQSNEVLEATVDMVDKLPTNEPVLHGARGTVSVFNKRLTNLLTRPVVSSLRSESEVAVASPNLSSIYDNDVYHHSTASEPDQSVFISKVESSYENERYRLDLCSFKCIIFVSTYTLYSNNYCRNFL